MNRFYPHPVVAREGWRIIATLAALTLIAFFCATNSPKLALWLLLATLASAHLFRDRVRNIPMDANALLSPADGRVILVENAHNPYAEQDALKISIRTHFFRAYAIRSPIHGSVQVQPSGKRHILRLQTSQQQAVTLVQNYGDCHAQTGSLVRGERIGFARFGGRVDVYLPPGSVPTVAIGDSVQASSSILAQLPERAAEAA
ncbi:phosphatidylserine decarboxylase [Kingella oralis]|jgi:phosphatidylserine decarboxylase proenzyme|uniref:Phosphatidylserine decarboxylase n=1 Tax=Kingella oralis ATCC 51147 TaxID=629741 RepID=C4GI26_9NEIS|nr:phosphatidylserine decarboxylase [Kingella oralis]EEP68614.1 putative phosphatidylserine decarboxylase [Kingella oralis ATCC 51147]QMT42115.1 phosphatidylserine decarboxylase family protein [Kingella oralis]